VWPQVMSMDLTWEMLRRSAAPWRVLGDASRLPVAGGCAHVVVWSNALGVDAPHHVPIPTALGVLENASDCTWSAVTSAAGWGLWAVLRQHLEPIRQFEHHALRLAVRAVRGESRECSARMTSCNQPAGHVMMTYCGPAQSCRTPDRSSDR